jgi:hypothetical protein
MRQKCPLPSPTRVSCLCNNRCLAARDLAVGYVLFMTSEDRAWLHDLRHRDRASAILVGQAIGMLMEAGPELGRPLADRIAHSRLSNLKELRPGSAGRSEIRILYVFDPRRKAVLLVAGDKAGKWEPGTTRPSRWPRNAMRTT